MHFGAIRCKITTDNKPVKAQRVPLIIEIVESYLRLRGCGEIIMTDLQLKLVNKYAVFLYE